jgi:4-hydroxy-tetrahydrodipicolinate synthase
VIDFGRVITAMVTPFTAEGEVDYAVAERLAAYLAAHGSDALVICGTTGESPTLSWEEEYQLFQVVQKAVAGKAKVIAGTGSNSTAEAIAATEKAARLKLDGAMLVVPYYNRPPQEGLYQHFRAIAQSAPNLPLILYNIPGRTGQNMLPETVARLSELPNIVGVKEASGSLDQASQIRQLTPPEFALYSGDDSLTLPIMAIGGTGVVSVASHLIGDALQTMVQAFVNGQVQAATALHLKFLSLFKALFVTTNPIPVKLALELQGWQVGGPRLPLVEADEATRQLLKTVLAEYALLEVEGLNA